MDLGHAQSLRLFHATAPGTCPYLPEQSESKLVVDLYGHDADVLYAELSRAGFRRSHSYAYRPACKDCSACIPVRVDAAAYRDSRSLRRVRRRNLDLTHQLCHPAATSEQYALFGRYQAARHGDSSMAEMSGRDYRAMIEDTPVSSFIMEVRNGRGELLAACLADWLEDGLSAVYSFFDPDEPERSLGTFMILRLIDIARAAELPVVYLGYWIAGSSTMDYKRRFPAVQGLVDARWTTLDEA